MSDISKFILTFFIIFAFNINANSQKTIFTGFKFGVNNSDIYNNVSDSVVFRNSYSGGVSFMMTFRGKENIKRTALLFDIAFMPMGYRYDNATFKINYLNLSIRPRYYFGLFGKLRSGFFFSGGPYFANLITASSSGYINGNSSNDSDMLDIYKPNDYGLILGGGWSLSGILSLEYNYNLGLAPIYRFSEFNIMNRSQAFYVRVAIPHKIKRKSKLRKRLNL